MNFYNIDMHISIIYDLRHIFKNLGHNIDSTCMSGHTWVNNEKQGTTEIINTSNWMNIDQNMCDRFYNRYKEELSKYDGFIHSYPPAFALLFEKFNKPIITIACTRYEFPCAKNIKWLNEGLMRLMNKGVLIPIANNLYDKAYCEEFCGGDWYHISSLCDYMKNSWIGGERIIQWKRSKICLNNINIDSSFDISRRYDRDLLYKKNAVIHIPYNLSIMSAFEQYYQNIPLFVPTIDCMKRWGNNILSELVFQDCPFKVKDEWLSLADWYDNNNMPYTIKFDSESHLYDMLNNFDFLSISNKMKEFNIERKNKIYSQWEEILKRIKK